VLLKVVRETTQKQECCMSVSEDSEGDITVTEVPYECY
jgi:hypothetical protein